MTNYEIVKLVLEHQIKKIVIAEPSGPTRVTVENNVIRIDRMDGLTKIEVA